MTESRVVDFIKELTNVRHPNTALIVDTSKIQGYTDDELSRLATRFNVSFTGQFYELMVQMGKCSGGLIYGYGIGLYGQREFDPTERQDTERYYKYLYGAEDEALDRQIFEKVGVFDVKARQLIEIGYDIVENYYLLTQDGDDRVWRYEHCTSLVKTDMTLLDYLTKEMYYMTERFSISKYGKDFGVREFDRMTASVFEKVR